MSWLTVVRTEALGLFVDDWPFAAAVLAWLALGWWLLPRLPVPPSLPPAILFAGLAAVLVGSAVRRAGR